jgi:predicted P-loop ATPase/GTPase
MPENILIFGYDQKNSGKTTLAISLAKALVNEGFEVGVFKPISAHNYWYDYTHLLECLAQADISQADIFSKDIWRIASAANCSLPVQILNPVDRLTSHPFPGVHEEYNMLFQSLAERITSCEPDGSFRSVYLLNEKAENKLIYQPEVLDRLLSGKDVIRCKKYQEWQGKEREFLPDAISSCYNLLQLNRKINIIESFNDEIPFILPDISYAIMVAPARIFVYSKHDFEKVAKFTLEMKRSVEGRDIYEEASTMFEVEVAPLNQQQLDSPDFLSDQIGKPILKTLQLI